MEQTELVRLLCAVLDQHEEARSVGALTESVAQQWIDAGFDDPEEVEAWLRARCFAAAQAQVLEAAGFTPEQAALRTKAGAADYEDTIAYKLNHSDLSLNEARRIITHAFWDS